MCYHTTYSSLFTDTPDPSPRSLPPQGRIHESMNFETAPFKLTREYLEVMGGVDSQAFKMFEDLFVRGFFALQKHADALGAIVQLFYGERRKQASDGLRSRLLFAASQVRVCMGACVWVYVCVHNCVLCVWVACVCVRVGVCVCVRDFRMRYCPAWKWRPIDVQAGQRSLPFDPLWTLPHPSFVVCPVRTRGPQADVLSLVRDSFDNWRTKQYDWFQMKQNGIIP